MLESLSMNQKMIDINQVSEEIYCKHKQRRWIIVYIKHNNYV